MNISLLIYSVNGNLWVEAGGKQVLHKHADDAPVADRYLRYLPHISEAVTI
jgi:hypothetical protein